jgi:hypothetical protein
MASKIEKDYPSTYFNSQLKVKNPQDWAKDSFQVAKSFVYSIQEGETPSPDYETKGQKIVAQRLALAGYRLANILNDIFATH